jgi:hypothetical protein
LGPRVIDLIPYVLFSRSERQVQGIGKDVSLSAPYIVIGSIIGQRFLPTAEQVVHSRFQDGII